jgi:hypothetical protein
MSGGFGGLPQRRAALPSQSRRGPPGPPCAGTAAGRARVRAPSGARRRPVVAHWAARGAGTRAARALLLAAPAGGERARSAGPRGPGAICRGVPAVVAHSWRPSIPFKRTPPRLARASHRATLVATMGSGAVLEVDTEKIAKLRGDSQFEAGAVGGAGGAGLQQRAATTPAPRPPRAACTPARPLEGPSRSPAPPPRRRGQAGLPADRAGRRPHQVGAASEPVLRGAVGRAARPGDPPGAHHRRAAGADAAEEHGHAVGCGEGRPRAHPGGWGGMGVRWGGAGGSRDWRGRRRPEQGAARSAHRRRPGGERAAAAAEPAPSHPPHPRPHPLPPNR